MAHALSAAWWHARAGSVPPALEVARLAHVRGGAVARLLLAQRSAQTEFTSGSADAHAGVAAPMGELLNVESDHPYVEYDSRQWLLRATNALPGSLELRFDSRCATASTGDHVTIFEPPFEDEVSGFPVCAHLPRIHFLTDMIRCVHWEPNH